MRELPIPYAVAVSGWFVLEIILLGRDVARGAATHRRDRGTRALLSATFFVAVLLSWTAPAGATLPVPMVFAVVGLVMIGAGLALRVWAVVTLGSSFRTFIGVNADQAVVTSGPYRWVRHPSYTGLLLIVIGFGVGSADLVAIVVALLLPSAAVVVRISVEEAELVRVLGEPYRAYQRTTPRLVPGLW